MSDKDRNVLLGGIQDVTLNAAEAQARTDGKRQVLMRKSQVVFKSAIEMRGFSDWIVHDDLEQTITLALEGKCFPAFWHAKDGATGVVSKVPLVGRLTVAGDTFEYFLTARGNLLWPPSTHPLHHTACLLCVCASSPF